MISHTIDGSLLVIKAEGKYSSDDIRATFTAALSDPKLPPKARLLIDARESLANPTVNEMEARLALLRSLRPRMAPFCAMGVTTPLHWGLARMYQAGSEIHDGPRIEVFKDINAAKQWLLSQVAVCLVCILGEVSPWLAAVA
jgi:hypothetical protein